ncbi:hypothetical protein OK351_16320 [Glutamicibacter sp. MNS18]|uniref:nitrilase-related carbon-nitrogen hydrolase n=1 Tax=Glutamicibacter sp. MNS18 TaxID=2989817 RepID=UPI00223607DF|nr:nitrilase-related carbon-nitrogen hydrolase [Glutamicibacter sp. MNS18]MCW4467050.1 hypothetical protein [Glutamicibacter sp. MNS18]
MRLAVLQHDAQPGDWQTNLARLEEAVAVAASNRVDILLSPELYVTGADARVLAKSFTAAAIRGLHEAIESLAASYGVALAYSLPEHRERQLLIGSYFVDAQGERLAHYARVHLATAAEREVFTAADEPPAAFEYQHSMLALSSGYDAQFPENVRAAALAGAKILLVPAAAEAGAAPLALKLLPARAMENGLYLLWANHCSVQGGIQMTGTSTIVGPDGQNIQVAGHQPQLIVADVDRQRQQAIRKAVPYLARLRPEVYR